MADQSTRRRTAFTNFAEAPVTEPGVAAVLFTRDEHGNIRSYVYEYPGHEGPDPELVAALAQSVEIRNL